MLFEQQFFQNQLVLLIQYPILLLERSLFLGIKIFYIPKGPFLNWDDKSLVQNCLQDLKEYTKKQKAVCLKIEPKVIKDHPFAIQTLKEDLLKSFKSKTRYNIRLARKKGVTITTSDKEEDLYWLYTLFKETGERKGFRINQWSYYKSIWQNFITNNKAQLFITTHEETRLGIIFVYYHNNDAWYIYNSDTGKKRNLMGNYLALWEIMKWLKTKKIKTFDLWGIPTTKEHSDSFKGVLRFKRGFQGEEVEWIGCWNYLPKSPWKKFFYKIEYFYSKFLWYTKRKLLY